LQQSLGRVQDNMDESDARADDPDHLEGENGELAAPREGHDDTAQVGEDLVAQVFGAGEASVRVPPHASNLKEPRVNKNVNS
jgi:hypothetical protein